MQSAESKFYWIKIAEWSHCDATTASDKSDVVNSANTSSKSVRQSGIDDIQM